MFHSRYTLTRNNEGGTKDGENMYQTKWNVNGLLGNDGTVRLINQTKGHGFHSTGTPCSRLLSLVRPVHRLLRALCAVS